MQNRFQMLYELQTMELSILKERKRSQAITALLADNQAIIEAQAKLQEAQEALSPVERKAKQLDDEMQKTIAKRIESEDLLYSGKIKNPKELQDLQNQIEALKRRKDQIETELLELLMLVDEKRAQLQVAKNELDQVSSELSDEHQKLIQEQADLGVSIAEAMAEREEFMGHIKPELLEIFAGLRKAKRFQPVSKLEDRICITCGIEQTNAIAAKVRQAEEVVYCASCGRILVSA
ncbi:hypothetical protein MASR2M15_00130 [Anaerolineales bacterium]